MAKNIEGDLFVIGGEQVYRSFLRYIEKWLVTEVPLTVEGADTFVPENYLAGFERVETKRLDQELVVSVYERRS
jgi:dihydrofolate reductase